MSRKLLFYNRYGVEEYYIYDPDKNELTGLERQQGELLPIVAIENWVSPRLGIRFELTPATLNLYDPQGNLFLSPVEIRQRAEYEAQRAQQESERAQQEKARADQEAQRAQQASERAQQEKARADQEAQRANQEKARADRLAAKLQALGIDPESF